MDGPLKVTHIEALNVCSFVLHFSDNTYAQASDQELAECLAGTPRYAEPTDEASLPR